MSDLDKEFTAKVFEINRTENTKCTIFVSIDVYKIDIDNLNI